MRKLSEEELGLLQILGSPDDESLEKAVSALAEVLCGTPSNVGISALTEMIVGVCRYIGKYKDTAERDNWIKYVIARVSNPEPFFDDDDELDDYAYERSYFAKYGHERHCRTCGKPGVKHFPTGPISSLNIEFGGWCSIKCFRNEPDERSGVIDPWPDPWPAPHKERVLIDE